MGAIHTETLSAWRVSTGSSWPTSGPMCLPPSPPNTVQTPPIRWRSCWRPASTESWCRPPRRRTPSPSLQRPRRAPSRTTTTDWPSTLRKAPPSNGWAPGRRTPTNSRHSPPTPARCPATVRHRRCRGEHGLHRRGGPVAAL